MIDKEQILRNAKKLKEKGLEANILKDSEKIHDSALSAAQKIWPAYHNTHVTPKTIGYISTLFDGDLSGKKVLDLGCGIINYLPVLGIALAKMGANVYGIDIHLLNEAGNKILKDNGINYLPLNLRDTSLYKNNKDFFSKNDLVVARSFLSGGLYENRNCIPLMDNASYQEEFNSYCDIINKVKEINSQDAVYELDSGVDFSKNPKKLLQDSFGKIICGFDKFYYNPFFIK